MCRARSIFAYVGDIRGGLGDKLFVHIDGRGNGRLQVRELSCERRLPSPYGHFCCAGSVDGHRAVDTSSRRPAGGQRRLISTQFDRSSARDACRRLTSATRGFHDWKTLYQDRHRFYMWLHTYIVEANLVYCSPTVPLLEIKDNAADLYL